MTMHGDREGSNALLRSAPGAMLEASCPTDGPSALIPAMLKDAERAVSSMSPWSSLFLTCMSCKFGCIQDS
jgi:hypothetical protein